MTRNCYDDTYWIKFTDSRKGTIPIPRKALIRNRLDIALVGKDRLEYGEVFDENILHLLENFAAPSIPGFDNKPDTTKTTDAKLSRPISGQTWFNTTKKRMYVFNGTEWLPLALYDDVAGNSGVLRHGASLPRPISDSSGYQFPYVECSWNVSPFHFPGQIVDMKCFTDDNGLVTMTYRLLDSPTILREGYVNYQIIGIKDNVNQGI